MTLTGGKRKQNKTLKAWVAFVKKVQKEEKLSYKDAIHRAKVRSDKGEKWKTMKGGDVEKEEVEVENREEEFKPEEGSMLEEEEDEKVVEPVGGVILGGKRRRKTIRGGVILGGKKRKTMRGGVILGGKRGRKTMRRRRSRRH